MTWQDLDPGVAVTPLQPDPAMDLAAGASVEVTSVDEFLSAALGPDRTIVLNAELFDLSTASSYGSIGGEYYYWAASYDGPELVIHDLSGLTIRSASSDPAAVTLAAIPRYANVLNFRDCENVSLLGFTAGHTKEPGSCSGGVLDLQNCNGITVDSMRLYGCGILGLQTHSCTSLDVLRTEIYECSQGAGMFFQTDGIRFHGCDIHDVPSPALRFTQCGDITWNDAPVLGMNGEFDISAEGELMPYEFQPEEEAVYMPYEFQPEEEAVYTAPLEDLVNPFADEPAHHYQAGFPQAVFAAAVQQAIADGNWEALADRIAFPVQIFVNGQSFPISSREIFLDSFSDENFTQFIQSTFNEDFRSSSRVPLTRISENSSHRMICRNSATASSVKPAWITVSPLPAPGTGLQRTISSSPPFPSTVLSGPEEALMSRSCRTFLPHRSLSHSLTAQMRLFG